MVNTRRWFILLILNALALLVADWVLPGMKITGFAAALLSALILGVVNTLVRPVLILVTLPFTVLTLGLFIFLVNAVVFALVAWLVPGFNVYSFGGAFWGAIITSLVSWILNQAVNPRRRYR